MMYCSTENALNVPAVCPGSAGTVGLLVDLVQKPASKSMIDNPRTSRARDTDRMLLFSFYLQGICYEAVASCCGIVCERIPVLDDGAGSRVVSIIIDARIHVRARFVSAAPNQRHAKSRNRLANERTVWFNAYHA